ncbi:MAG: hypothetical protein H0W70_09070 [Actinobacteria bacterium]|nr:hypothetical protein [Actinomycetota bacterium]
MILAYVPDLMDRSKVAAVADVTFAAQVDDLINLINGEADVVVVDLSRPGVLDAIPAIRSGRIIGFASHVDRPLLDAARTAGCTEVLARSAFFARVADLLEGG